MSREPRRLADVGGDASPDAAFLSSIIHAHRNGRPDGAKMDELSRLVRPFLTSRATTAAHLSRVGPMLVSALLAASVAWLALHTDAVVSTRPTATSAAGLPAEVPAAPEGATPDVADPLTPAVSVHALPNLDAPASPDRPLHGAAREPRSPTKSKTEAVASPTSCDDVALIERAGAELRAGRAAHALATTRQHETRCSDGLLAQERERIAIEALAVLGRASEARARASSFEARYPSSPHLRRLRQVVGALGE
ncbi:MAG: hypothetical protein KF850_12015 [Labilithrix sp.]|nr:hypothetical protein [Labilithrix sp.]